MTTTASNLREPWDEFDQDLEGSVAAVSAAEVEAIDKAMDLQLISIRLPKGLIKQLKLIAKFHCIGYQPLVRDVLLRFSRSELRSLLIQFEESKRAEAELGDADSPAAKFFEPEKRVAVG